MRRISGVAMLALHEIVRDAGRNLMALTGDDFIDGLSKTFADLLTAFHVGLATIRDSRGTRVGPVIVVATKPIADGEIDADAVAVAIFACAQLRRSESSRRLQMHRAGQSTGQGSKQGSEPIDRHARYDHCGDFFAIPGCNRSSDASAK